MKPPPYRYFFSTKQSALLQVRDPQSGELVDPGDLHAYLAKVEVRAPGRTLKPGAVLFLTETQAAAIADGIVALRELPPDPALMPPPPAPKISRPRSGKTKGGSAGGEAGDGRTTRKS